MLTGMNAIGTILPSTGFQSIILNTEPRDSNSPEGIQGVVRPMMWKYYWPTMSVAIGTLVIHGIHECVSQWRLTH